MFRRLTQEKVDVSKGPFSLQKRPEVAKSNVTRQLVNSTNTGTIQAFVYPLQAQKTGTMVLCSPTGTSNPGEPDCSTGQYNLCKCVGADCSKCTHSGYVNVMNISNVIRVELLAAPDAGRPNAASAQLVVRTLGMSAPMLDGCFPKSHEFPVQPGNENFYGSTRMCCDVPMVNNQCPSMKGPFDLTNLCRTGDFSSTGSEWMDFFASWFNSNVKLCDSPNLPKVQTTFEETIPLPEIPFQKWTFITIAREGRRFDIYYNGKLVMSKRTQNVMDTRAAFGPITAGDPNLTGKIALVETFPQKLTQEEVMAKYKANSDTTGQPTLDASGTIFDYLPNCKDGGCISGPKMRPTSPLLDWQTRYA